ncbi:MAG: hypothetical protein QOK16_3486 [Solirubrobacteraceae bacterium]|jgi:hypothetical protein|nr:hypothetical protein [Solirubrobacteraceae bacterium]
MVRSIMPLLLAVLVLAPIAGCGADRSGRPTGASRTATTADAALPALARRPAAPGEIVVRGETSPQTHGPYVLDRRYLVRFEQYAPEDPKLDFASQTSFTATLTPRRGDPRGAIDLFQAATRDGQRELTIRGRYFVDVSFGDYPYVIRFTPRSA